MSETSITEVPKCACDSIVDSNWLETARAVCTKDVSYQKDGKNYCVMHYPSKDKVEAFRVELRNKLDSDSCSCSKYNFCGVYFPEDIHFDTYKKPCENSFSFNTGAHFGFATFSGLADFNRVIFENKAVFGDAKFEKNARFHFASFNAGTDFGKATFTGWVSFWAATFSVITFFDSTKFLYKVNFQHAQFKEYVKFIRGDEEMFGKTASLEIDFLRIDIPERQRLSFHSVKLRPNWFINSDSRKMEFIDVDWGNIKDELGSELKSTQERLSSPNPPSGHEQLSIVYKPLTMNANNLLSTTYRQLAVNAEENSRYEEAMKFRYASMETSFLSSQKKWREDWSKQHCGKWSFETFSWWWDVTLTNLFSLSWWYRTLSGYGESVTRAAIALLLILFLSCVPYQFTGFAPSKYPEDKIGAPLPNVARALVYSLETASLQKPEPRPVTTAARFFVGLETILAPLQAALLALAIRRKYMR